MSNVTHMNCPVCKGALGVTGFDRFVRCGFCDAHLLVDHPDYLPQYVVSPRTDAVSARRALQTFLTSRFLPGGLLSRARFIDAILVYVPFYEHRTRRLGTIETGLSKTVGTRMVPDGDGNGSMYASFKEIRETVSVRATEMVMSDICRIEPATSLPDFGLSCCGVYEYLREKPELQPLGDGSRLADARVYPVTVSEDALLAQMQTGGALVSSVLDDTRFVESRTRIVYYPLWRLKYRFAGQLYSAVLDGLSGELLRVTAPEGDQMRVFALLAGVAFVGITVGGFLRTLTAAQLEKGLFFLSHAGSAGAVLAMIIGCLAVLGGVWALAWSQFRWPGEVHKVGNDYHVEKYNGLLRKRIRLPLLTPETLLKMVLGRR